MPNNQKLCDKCRLPVKRGSWAIRYVREGRDVVKRMQFRCSLCAGFHGRIKTNTTTSLKDISDLQGWVTTVQDAIYGTFPKREQL